MAYLARKDESGRTQTMREHSANVSKACGATCAEIGLAHLGRLAGLLHDLGKCTVEFAGVLDTGRHGSPKVKHALLGARYAIQELGGMHNEMDLADDSSPRTRTAVLIAEAIESHHQGLIDLVSPLGTDTLGRAVFQEDERYLRAKSAFTAECATESEIAELFERAISELKALDRVLAHTTNVMLAGKPENARTLQSRFSWGMVARFVASALIDADRCDARAWSIGSDGSDKSENANWRACCANVSTYLDGLARDAATPSVVFEARRAVTEACVTFATSKLEPGVFCLTAATGSGKTLGALLGAATFASRAEQPPRVFYLAPYKTILTQNAEEWRKAVGGAVEILEHHSDVIAQDEGAEGQPHDGLRELLAERWSSPIVVSTLVQFLHTLFSPQPSRVRRFQALAGSVIVIDEIQSLPLRLVAIVNAALNFLAGTARCTVICMTATQPALELGPLPLALHPLSEMIAPEIGFAPCFDRVGIVSRIFSPLGTAELASFVQERQANEGSVLVVVNTKPGARKLYRELVRRGEDVVLLTQHLCARHRLDLIEKVKRMLDEEREGEGKPFICISTSLIEAGVNLSFPCGVRCLIGLDSVAQAAGRVNRNGEAPFGTLYIVEYRDENLGKLEDMARKRDCAREALLRHRGAPRIGSEAVQKYFQLLFKRHSHLLEGPIDDLVVDGVSLKRAKNLLGLFTSNPYDGVSPEPQRALLRHALRTGGLAAKPIDDDTQAVIVGYGDGERLFREIEHAEAAQLPRLLARAQPYSVGLTISEMKRLAPFISIDERSGARFLAQARYDKNEGVMPPDANLQ